MNVKGSALRARLKYLKEKNATERVVSKLQPATRAIVDAGILPNHWYPFAAFIDLAETIDRVLGSGDLGLCVDVARYACDANLTTLYKIFFRIADPQYILKRVSAAWSMHYDEGSLTVVKEGDREATARLEIPEPHRAHCLSILGWGIRAIELSGGKDVKAVETCKLRGDPYCDITLRWR